jgi:glycyl-tRNA synthetase
MKKDSKVITFQEIIERLNAFWGSKGCVVAQPYGLEVGAGTANPNTFLRSLGPEPFNVAYVEPSRRPDDGRYGKNPYRLQHYFQYQIILKPAPENNQELYFEMLDALGIDTKKHDIRFVEDNWESPAIGAWGLGWEVWLDGMEISQYTYFQQVSGIPLDVPTLEITLGLERLAMYIQGVDDYRDIMWNDEVKYGDLFEKHEYWQSKHNYETANIGELKKIYDLMEKQVENQLEVKNYWVAYDYLLKISHIFNILDSRGVVSMTDRISKFKMMGRFSKGIGDLYLSEREEMKYPLTRVVKPVEYILSKEKPFKESKVTKKDQVVLEMYFEELPADFVRQWRENYHNDFDMSSLLKDLGFNFKNVNVYWGPRRIVFVIDGCGDLGVVKKEAVGPMYEIAFEGKKLNKVGLGFLKKYNAKKKDIVKVEKGGKALFGVKIEEKTKLDQALELCMQKLLEVSPSWKSMKWMENQKDSFVRPLRNIVCFKDDKKIEVSFMGVQSSDYTFCTRYYEKNIIGISSASNYFETMKKLHVIIDESYRKGIIESAVDEGRGKYNYSPNTENLIEMNTYLVEYPNVEFLKLDQKYVNLPIELISKVLEENQKYIIRVLKTNSKHIEYGVIANKKDEGDVIFKGNIQVLQGRLDDALFYWENDLKKPKLKELRDELENIVFHPKLGSYKQKVLRIEKLVKKILKNTNLKISKDVLKKAMELIKNDKATHMVGEFASLEGIIGSYYAQREGYPIKVSKLLYEHYLPTSEASKLPSTSEGIVLSIADKLDNILSFTKIGFLPEGSNDPYEVRKNVYNLIRLLMDIDFDLDGVLKSELDEKNYKKLSNFINHRIYLTMKESTRLDRLAKGIAFSNNGSVFKKFEYLKELEGLIEKKEDEDKIFDTIKRVGNILSKSDIDKFKIQEKFFETKSEKELHKFLLKFKKKDLRSQDILFLAGLLEKFFEETMVNVDDKKLRNNRISLLKELSENLNMVLKV